MHPSYLGDSYDIVKRFFCEALRRLGYTVYIDPMFTGEWSGQEASLYKFLGVQRLHGGGVTASAATALFLDPDTGVNGKGGRRHASFERVATEALKHQIVFAFDQGFSRATLPKTQIEKKLAAMLARGCRAFYYDSHARFIFASRDGKELERLRAELVSQGLPNTRLVGAN